MARLERHVRRPRKGRPGGLRVAPARRRERDAVDELGERLSRLDGELEDAIRTSEKPRREGGWTELAASWNRLPDLRPLLERLEEIRGAERSDDFGLDPQFQDLIAPLFAFLYRQWWQVRTKGVEQVPASGAALIVANHAGTMFPYDAAMLKMALRLEHPAARDLRTLVDDFVFRTPFLASAIARVGGVRACPENGERLLREGEVVAVFPEGIRGMSKPFRERYRLRRFGRGGFVSLALRTGAPIIPAAIVGAEEIHPLLGSLEWPAKLLGLPYLPITPTFPWLGLLGLVPLPSKWVIRVGSPIALADRYEAEAADDPVLLDRITEEVRETIQDMLEEELHARGSAFF